MEPEDFFRVPGHGWQGGGNKEYMILNFSGLGAIDFWFFDFLFASGIVTDIIMFMGELWQNENTKLLIYIVSQRRGKNKN